MDEFAQEMIREHTHYKNGLLPFAGGTYDQPAIFMQAMAIIDQAIEEHQANGKRT